MVPSISAARESWNKEPGKEVKHRTTHTQEHKDTYAPHHGVESQRMVPPGGSRGVVPVPEVLQLLLGLVQHLDALGVFLLQLLKLLGSLESNNSIQEVDEGVNGAAEGCRVTSAVSCLWASLAATRC